MPVTKKSRVRKASRPKAAGAGRGRELRVLNVRADSRRSRRIRRVELARESFRWMAVVIAVLVVTVLLRHAFQQALYENEHFALRHIEFETNGRLGQQQVLDAAMVHEEQNLLAADLGGIRERILALPQVREVEVERILPDGLGIRVQERNAIAWLACPELGIRPRNSTVGFLVDENGYVFRCEALSHDYLWLPVLEVPRQSVVDAGRQLSGIPEWVALEVLRQSDAVLEPSGLRVSEAAVRNAYSLSLRFSTGELAIVSTDDAMADLQRFANIHAQLAARNQTISQINLLAQKNVPALLVGGSSDGGGTPRVLRARSVDLPGEEGSSDEGSSSNQNLPANDLQSDVQAILNRG